ncbi:family 16 glycosylhydrolase [Fictibacillus iocasae]|uniref:Family 16 glycosylhydrolase n=1 Tax=Fictibacillus iocasae TaxID=2715437 RepID=A0ABW2NMU5_9BACL
MRWLWIVLGLHSIIPAMGYSTPVAVHTKTSDGYHLVWNDEFRQSGSLNNWNIQDWASDKNNEWQYYSPENVTVSDGFLKITSKRERLKGRTYTSGAVTTQHIFSFQYGKVEIRAKLPKGQGVFPAFWLVTEQKKKWLPEIDMMENLGHEPNVVHQVVHWIDKNGRQQRDYSKYTSETDYSEDFHRFGLIWEKDKITWTVDDQKVFETTKFSPSQPLFLYMNTAIGGNWPGDPNPKDAYPKEMLIDYVRIYQK